METTLLWIALTVLLHGDYTGADSTDGSFIATYGGGLYGDGKHAGDKLGHTRAAA
jgi:hypothetical protein